jgi:hypothetical protein
MAPEMSFSVRTITRRQTRGAPSIGVSITAVVGRADTGSRSNVHSRIEVIAAIKSAIAAGP